MPSEDDGRLDYRLGGHNDITGLIMALTRLDAKFDTVMRMMTLRDEAVNGQLKNLNVEHEKDHTDHETRLRTLEARPVLTPKSVYAMLGLIIAVVGTSATVIGLILRGP